MGVTEEAGKVGTSAVEAMRSVPLAIALLMVNAGFLGFSAYFLAQVGANASERNKSQMDLIGSLVKEVADCHRQKSSSMLFMPDLTNPKKEF